MPIITFLTDFGLRDSYVAEMKAALLRRVPSATVIDITHQIEPQDVLAASVMLGRVLDAFPAGTIHVAVVDPGVGTSRRLLAVRIARQIVLCPDNGLITWAWRTHRGAVARAVHWQPETRRGVTFDGRDRFAPLAAMLLKHRPLSALSKPISDPILSDVAPATDGVGQVIYVDRYGNAVTNLMADRLHPGCAVLVKRRTLQLHRAYGDVRVGEALALIGSANLLEIAVRNGSAAVKLNLTVGDLVRIRSCKIHKGQENARRRK